MEKGPGMPGWRSTTHVFPGTGSLKPVTETFSRARSAWSNPLIASLKPIVAETGWLVVAGLLEVMVTVGGVRSEDRKAETAAGLLLPARSKTLLAARETVTLPSESGWIMRSQSWVPEAGVKEERVPPLTVKSVVTSPARFSEKLATNGMRGRAVGSEAVDRICATGATVS